MAQLGGQLLWGLVCQALPGGARCHACARAGVAEDNVKWYRDAALCELPHRPDERVAAAELNANRVRLRTSSDVEPWMLIVLEEKEHNCDLVMIGRQAHHALDGFLLGSTSRRVIAEGAVDVPLARR